jgi:hypothetical protein
MNGARTIIVGYIHPHTMKSDISITKNRKNISVLQI